MAALGYRKMLDDGPSKFSQLSVEDAGRHARRDIDFFNVARQRADPNERGRRRTTLRFSISCRACRPASSTTKPVIFGVRRRASFYIVMQSVASSTCLKVGDSVLRVTELCSTIFPRSTQHASVRCHGGDGQGVSRAAGRCLFVELLGAGRLRRIQEHILRCIPSSSGRARGTRTLQTSCHGNLRRSRCSGVPACRPRNVDTCPS